MAVAEEEGNKFFVVHTAVNGPLGDIEAIYMVNWPHRSRFPGINVFITMLRVIFIGFSAIMLLRDVRCGWTGLRFATTDGASSYEIWLIHHCTE